jgi:YidC/Oxa1 family membrane protein insertase
MLAFAPLAGPTSAAYVLVTHLATILGPVGGTATAIIVFTMLVRLLLHPLTRAAVRGERARARLAPRVAELRRKHQGNPTRLAEELTMLHRDEGISPFAGFLPLLAQAPFFLVTYQIFVRSSVGQHANVLMTHTLFGAPLGDRFSAGVGSGSAFAVFLGLFAALAGLAWLTGRRATKIMALTAVPGTGAANGSGPGAALVARVLRVLPYVTVVTAAFVPLAAGLYLLTSTGWTLVENVLLRRGLPG